MSEEIEVQIIKGDYVPIPEEFWSDLDKKPFENCRLCKKFLLEDGELYVIEKAYRTYRGSKAKSTVFEHAICLECLNVHKGKLSSMSKLKIEQYQGERLTLEERREELEGNSNLKDWLSECILHHEPVSEGGEYQIYAECDGQEMFMYHLPYMIRGEAIDEMLNLLSNETLDEINGLQNDLTSGPPELRELLEEVGPRVLI